MFCLMTQNLYFYVIRICKIIYYVNVSQIVINKINLFKIDLLKKYPYNIIMDTETEEIPINTNPEIDHPEQPLLDEVPEEHILDAEGVSQARMLN